MTTMCISCIITLTSILHISELFLPMVSVEVTNVIVDIRVCASYRKLYSLAIYVLVI